VYHHSRFVYARFASYRRTQADYARLVERLRAIDTLELSDDERRRVWNARADYKRRAQGRPGKLSQLAKRPRRAEGSQ